MARGGNGANAVTVGPNEVLRFILEVVALSALGYAGWNLVEDALVSVVLATALPLLGATVWAVFRVDGDPKVAPVPVPGVVRLCIEVDFFTTAVVLLAVVGQVAAAGLFAALLVGHYAWGHRRVRWLVRHPGRLPEMRDG
jgi:ABC-type sugar transport system permease subunit